MTISRRTLIASAMAAALPAAAPAATGDEALTINNQRFDPATARWEQLDGFTRRAQMNGGGFVIVWYRQAKSPVDGAPLTVLVVERQRAPASAPQPAARYLARWRDQSFSIADHVDFARWVATSRPWPTSDRWIEQWRKAGLLLPWGAGPRLALPPRWAWMADPVAYAPLGDAGLVRAMGTTGLRDDIGPILQRHARYLISGDKQDRAVAMATGQAMASIVWHLRDAGGAPLLMDSPAWRNRALRQYYAAHSDSERIETVDEGPGGWSIDNAHRPCAAFLPALLTGLHPFFIEEQIFSACAVLNTASPSVRGASGLLIDRAQGRDFTWGLRDLLLAQQLVLRSGLTPWRGLANRLAAVISANLDAMLLALGRGAGATLGAFWADAGNANAPNPTTWVASRLSSARAVYQGPIPDFLGYVLEWGARLSPDKRWRQAQRQFAERYQAARLLALGPYAYTTVPLAMGGRWAASWAEVAQWLRLSPATARQRWVRPSLPVDDKAAYPYDTEYPLNAYHSMKFALRAHPDSAVLRDAVALFERQIDAAPEAARTEAGWPAFAMSHG